jgi:hypothetical protein
MPKPNVAWRGVLLDNANLPAGMLALREIGKVQARWARACDQDFHFKR